MFKISSNNTVLGKLLEWCKPNPLFWCLSYENQQKGTQPIAETSYIPGFLYGDAVLEAHSDRFTYQIWNSKRKKRFWTSDSCNVESSTWCLHIHIGVAQHHGKSRWRNSTSAVPSDPWCWRKEVTLPASGLAESTTKIPKIPWLSKGRTSLIQLQHSIQAAGMVKDGHTLYSEQS